MRVFTADMTERLALVAPAGDRSSLRRARCRRTRSTRVSRCLPIGLSGTAASRLRGTGCMSARRDNPPSRGEPRGGSRRRMQRARAGRPSRDSDLFVVVLDRERAALDSDGSGTSRRIRAAYAREPTPLTASVGSPSSFGVVHVTILASILAGAGQFSARQPRIWFCERLSCLSKRLSCLSKRLSRLWEKAFAAFKSPKALVRAPGLEPGQIALQEPKSC
jgi:hypothetical protein